MGKNEQNITVKGSGGIVIYYKWVDRCVRGYKMHKYTDIIMTTQFDTIFSTFSLPTACLLHSLGMAQYSAVRCLFFSTPSFPSLIHSHTYLLKDGYRIPLRLPPKITQDLFEVVS